MEISHLDDALSYLAKNITNYTTHDILKKEVFKNSPTIDVEAIIDKLKRDGYIHFGSATSFKLSVEGSEFIKEGMYNVNIPIQLEIKQNTRKKLALDVINSQRMKNTYWVTFGLAIASFVISTILLILKIKGLGN